MIPMRKRGELWTEEEVRVHLGWVQCQFLAIEECVGQMEFPADKRDDLDSRVAKFFDVLAVMVPHVNGMVGAFRNLMPLTPLAAKALVDESKPSRAAPCVNCSRMVENTANDPIRSGRCGACWQYRRRNEGGERPRDLWEEAT